MRKVYHSIARRSKSAPEFVQGVQGYFENLGDNWQRPAKQDLYLFYRMNGYGG